MVVVPTQPELLLDGHKNLVHHKNTLSMLNTVSYPYITFRYHPTMLKAGIFSHLSAFGNMHEYHFQNQA